MKLQEIDLALAFLESRPRPAAEILEQQPLEHVVAFLAEVPQAQAGPVLTEMLPQVAARVCKMLPPATAAGFLAAMELSAAASVLRQIDARTRVLLLRALPEKNRLACKILLNYPETAVGAWMVTELCCLPGDCTVAQGLSRIASEQDLRADSVAVVDRDKRYRGMVTIAGLLRALPETPIADVLVPVVPISGRATLGSAEKHPGWDTEDVMPVINRHRRFVGLLRHVDFRKGMARLSKTITRVREADQITGFGTAYGRSLLALYNAAFECFNVNGTQRG